MKKEHYGGITWTRKEAESKGSYIADRDLYADKDGNLVEADDPKQAFFIAKKGSPVSPENVERYGLKKSKKAAPEAEEEVDGGEKASSPSANKAARPTKNKAVAKKGAKK